MKLGSIMLGMTFIAASAVGCASPASELETLSEAREPVLTFDISVLDEALSDMVERGDAVGVSALVYHCNQEAYYGQFGASDREAGRAWQRDVIANIYSMTKPVTGVTLMTLYEDGLFELDDPLSKYLPEFANVKVYAGEDDSGEPVLVDPKRPITILDTMRHTSGYGYGWSGTPSDNMLAAANLFDPSTTIAEFNQNLAQLPLNFHPGEQWKYSVSVDIQARLAEVLSGKPYDQLVRERVLDPLDMDETGYFVPKSNKPRVSAVYIKGEDGVFSREPDSQVYGFWPKKPVQINGGHGLASTIDDYMTFALMLQNEGVWNGVQIIKPETLDLMTEDHLNPGITERDFLPGKGQLGFGIDFAVRTDPPVDDQEHFGVVGEFFWDGRASTLFWVDPESDITAIFFTQVVPFNENLHKEIRRAVYQSAGMIESSTDN